MHAEEIVPAGQHDRAVFEQLQAQARDEIVKHDAFILFTFGPGTNPGSTSACATVALPPEMALSLLSLVGDVLEDLKDRFGKVL